MLPKPPRRRVFWYRKPLRRVGAATRRYLVVREALLWGLWAEHAEKGAIMASVPCGCGCGRGVGMWRRGSQLRSDGHVDHILKRSLRPDLRCDPKNMQLLTATCHRAKHAAGKGGL